MALNDIYRVAFEYSVDGQTCVNVLHMQHIKSLADGNTAQNLADALALTLPPVWKFAIGGQEATGRKVSTSLISRTNTDIGEAAYAFTAFNPLYPSFPSLVAAVIRLRTGFAGRSGRGRMYLSGVPNFVEDQGKLNQNGINHYAGFIQALDDFCGPGATDPFVRLGVFGRTPYTRGNAAPQDYFKPVQTFQVVNTLTSQRRRRPGIGS
jgi:hypothetical protein